MFDNSTKGNIFKIQRFSLHDGPGIRTTVFLKGCPLKCDWCSNPEGQSLKDDILFYRQLCIGCGACKQACTKGLINSNTFEIDRSRCDNCGDCAGACLVHAKELVGTEMTVSQVKAVINRDSLFYKNSGGGVTLSGGEPAWQDYFASKLLHSCRKNAIHTALETSGCIEPERILQATEYCDLVLFDLKTLNEEKGRTILGIDKHRIVENLSAIASKNRRICLRYAVIPEFNDSLEDIHEFVKMALELGTLLTEVSILPFHRLADGKYQALGLKYRYSDYNPQTPKSLESIKLEFASRGIPVRIEY